MQRALGRHLLCAFATSAVRGFAFAPLQRVAPPPLWRAPQQLALSRTRRLLACEAAPDLYPVLEGWIAKALDAEERKRASLHKEAESAKKAESLGKWATLIVSNLYRIDPAAESVTVEDWEDGGKPIVLRLDPSKGSAQQQADEAFVKARRMRRGSAVVEGLITESEATSNQLKTWRAAATAFSDDDEALKRVRAEVLRKAKALRLKPDALQAPSPSQAAAAAAAGGGRAGAPRKATPDRVRGKQPWTGRTLESPAGIPILVGRNRRENELLSLVIARHPDVWMHVRGVPGAHVVLRVSQAGRRKPTDECMQMAANLAAFYSDMRAERKATVSYTSPKHITKPARAPLGAVQLRKEDGTWLGRPEDVPDDLVEAREQFDPRTAD